MAPRNARQSNLPDPVDSLEQIERKVLWLSSWLIHNANHLRPSRDGLKVGGHQASCASAATLLTALYMNVLQPEDRVAVKPHASPVFHAIQYLFGRQSRDQLERFRSLGGAQSYPSRTKDADDVDFSTGSVGLGVGATLFAAMVRDYVRLHGLSGGDGLQGRDFTFVENVVEANLAAARAAGPLGAVTLNIACGVRTNLLELIAALGRILASDPAPVFEAPRAGDVMHSQADVSRARAMLDFREVVPFEEGLARTVEYYRGGGA